MDDINDDGLNSTEPALSFSDFMSNIEESMLKIMRESAKAPTDAYEHWQAFSHAIDWNECWIKIMLISHAFLFVLVIIARKNISFQTIVFLSICSLVFLSERINAWCSENWRSFSKQNYFDAHGVFAGIMFSSPLLFIGFVQLVNLLYITSSELIIAKRLELKARRNKVSDNTPNKESANDQSSNNIVHSKKND